MVHFSDGKIIIEKVKINDNKLWDKIKSNLINKDFMWL